MQRTLWGVAYKYFNEDLNNFISLILWRIDFALRYKVFGLWGTADKYFKKELA